MRKNSVFRLPIFIYVLLVTLVLSFSHERDECVQRRIVTREERRMNRINRMQKKKATTQ